MDVLERVREIGADRTPDTEDSVDAARRKLFREIAQAESIIAKPRLRWAVPTLIVSGVAAAAIGISVIAPVRVDTAAAAVLERAAEVAVSASDPALTSGQYLKITTFDQVLVNWDVDMPAQWARFNNGSRADADAVLVVQSEIDLYVPADRADEWVQDAGTPARVVDTFGARTDEAIADWNDFGGGSSSGVRPDTLRLPGGAYSGAEGDQTRYLLDSFRPYYDDMPRDPEQLLKWFRDFSGDPEISDHWVVGTIGDTVGANLMPADLRAASFRALALINGIQVTGRDGNHTTLAYGAGSADNPRTEITLNTAEGVIESIATTTNNQAGPAAASVPDQRTTITMNVVNSAP